MKTLALNKEYFDWIKELGSRYRQSQIKAAVAVNSTLLEFYWNLGQDIVNLDVEKRWGQGVIKALCSDLQRVLPNVKGLSVTNVYYCRSFYHMYREIFPQLGGIFMQTPLAMIPWGHHKAIIDKCKSNPSKALFYVQKSSKDNWSRSVLLNYLDSNLYESHGKAVTNFSSTMPLESGELAKDILKDPYNFDFLQLADNYHEKELKDALIENISRFLMELGTGYAYMGKEYRLVIGKKEQFLDLLFYNVQLHCFMVVEVKTTDFEAAYLGQLSAYVSCVDRLLKSCVDQPTIGLLICKSKDNVFAQYSLDGYRQPLGISEYKGMNFNPQNFESSLPSIESIEMEIRTL